MSKGNVTANTSRALFHSEKADVGEYLALTHSTTRRRPMMSTLALFTSSVQTSNQLPHVFCLHHAPSLARHPNRASCVKLPQPCSRHEFLDACSIESATCKNRDLWRRRLLIAFQPLRPHFQRAIATTG